MSGDVPKVTLGQGRGMQEEEDRRWSGRRVVECQAEVGNSCKAEVGQCFCSRQELVGGNQGIKRTVVGAEESGGYW